MYTDLDRLKNPHLSELIKMASKLSEKPAGKKQYNFIADKNEKKLQTKHGPEKFLP